MAAAAGSAGTDTVGPASRAGPRCRSARGTYRTGRSGEPSRTRAGDLPSLGDHLNAAQNRFAPPTRGIGRQRYRQFARYADLMKLFDERPIRTARLAANIE